MTSPRHSPPPSADAPRPRGILKNVANARNSANSAPAMEMDTERSTADEEHAGRLAWDEGNLIFHEMERQQQDPRMKIDEPKTPFVHSASLGAMNDDFDLDGQQGGPSVVTNNFAGPSDLSQQHSEISSSRRSSAAEVLAANTKANAATAGGALEPETSREGLEDEEHTTRTRRGPDSRSPSFTLPGSRRSSAGDKSREDVREEMRSRSGDHDAMEDVEGDGATAENTAALDDDDDDDDEGEMDEEAKAKQDAFARKRNAHYGNEAEAMKVAAALAAQDDDDDDDDDDAEEEGEEGQGEEGQGEEGQGGVWSSGNHLPNGR